MDLEDVEDLLFGAPDSQQYFNNSWNDDFDDEEMLDVADNLHDSDDDDLFDALGLTTADSWQLLSSPSLTPADAPVTLQHNAVMSSADGGARSVDVGTRRPRDRCHGCPAKRSKC